MCSQGGPTNPKIKLLFREEIRHITQMKGIHLCMHQDEMFFFFFVYLVKHILRTHFDETENIG